MGQDRAARGYSTHENLPWVGREGLAAMGSASVAGSEQSGALRLVPMTAGDLSVRQRKKIRTALIDQRILTPDRGVESRRQSRFELPVGEDKAWRSMLAQ